MRNGLDSDGTLDISKSLQSDFDGTLAASQPFRLRVLTASGLIPPDIGLRRKPFKNAGSVAIRAERYQSLTLPVGLLEFAQNFVAAANCRFECAARRLVAGKCLLQFALDDLADEHE
jgi:hypothetical protein